MMCFETIAAKDLENLIGKDEVLLVDLRDSKVYKQGHIATAINIPLQRLKDSNYDMNKYITDTKNEIVLYCDRGGSSLLASRELCKRGFKVKNVYGGIRAYRGQLDKDLSGNCDE